MTASAAQKLHPIGPADLEQSVVDRFRSVAAAHPDVIAARDQRRSLTYAELDAAANRLAQAILAALGSGSEAVPFLLGHSVQAIIAIMGIVKAGKLYLALNETQPIARLAEVASDAQPRLIITSAEHRALVEDILRAVPYLEPVTILDIDHLPETASSEPPAVSISPHDGLFLVYTSGSTGRPKGITQDHENTLYSAMLQAEGYSLTPDDRLAMLFTHSYGAARGATFGALLSGAGLVLYDLQQRGLTGLVDWLAQERITILPILPTVFRHLIQLAERAPLNLPDLRMLHIGGETVTRRDVELCRTYLPHTTIEHTYSASEVGRITQLHLKPGDAMDEPVIPAGYPVAEREVLILDPEGRALPPDQIGEIAVRSRYLMPGYWRQPGLTDRVLLPDPEGGQRPIYRTGDLGMVRDDGLVLHLGRVDQQVKIRGQRIEVAEIEMALLEHPGVNEAVVALRGEERLVAFWVPSEQPAPDDGTLRQWLAERLPAVMIPAAFVMLESLPTTSTGKVDVNALPTPDFQTRRASKPFAPPRNSLEMDLVEIWEQTLGITPIGIWDEYGELGGDSLNGMRIISRIERRFGKRLPVEVLHPALTVVELSQSVRREDMPVPWPSLVALQPEGTKPPLYCVHGLGGHVYFYYQLARLLGPDQPVYGLRARGLDGVSRPRTSLVQMAADYIKEIGALQPEGPYHLAGFSSGGKIAFEMARQLRAQGQTVGLVAAVDTSVVKRDQEVDAELPAAPAAPATPARVSLMTRLRRSFRWRISRPIQRVLLGYYPEWPPEKRIRISSRTASANYRWQPYGERVVLLRSEEFRQTRPDPREVWGRWASEVELVDVPGTHYSILREPDVQAVAQVFRDLLNR